MDLLYRHGRATARELHERLADPPSYSAVRALLRVLEDKGYLRHSQSGARYIYEPIEDRKRARGSALRHLVDTFFDGSATQAMAALLDLRGEKLSPAELDELRSRIEAARKEGR